MMVGLALAPKIAAKLATRRKRSASTDEGVRTKNLRAPWRVAEPQDVGATLSAGRPASGATRCRTEGRCHATDAKQHSRARFGVRDHPAGGDVRACRGDLIRPKTRGRTPILPATSWARRRTRSIRRSKTGTFRVTNAPQFIALGPTGRDMLSVTPDKDGTLSQTLQFDAGPERPAGADAGQPVPALRNRGDRRSGLPGLASGGHADGLRGTGAERQSR